MLYAALISYNADPSLIQSTRPRHREYLAGLKAEGKIALSGPFADDSGGLLVYNTETPEQTEALIKADPFCEVGVFASWNIKPWKIILCNHDLMPT